MFESRSRRGKIRPKPTLMAKRWVLSIENKTEHRRAGLAAEVFGGRSRRRKIRPKPTIVAKRWLLSIENRTEHRRAGGRSVCGLQSEEKNSAKTYNSGETPGVATERRLLRFDVDWRDAKHRKQNRTSAGWLQKRLGVAVGGEKISPNLQ